MNDIKKWYCLFGITTSKERKEMHKSFYLNNLSFNGLGLGKGGKNIVRINKEEQDVKHVENS